MATSDLLRFRDLLNNDEEFQAKLRQAAEAYTGEPDDKSVFENLLLPLGQEYGISATYEEFKALADAVTGKTQGELSEEELEQVAGGKSGSGICFVVGGSAGGEATGSVEVSDGTGYVEGHACYYAGIGIILPVMRM